MEVHTCTLKKYSEIDWSAPCPKCGTEVFSLSKHGPYKCTCGEFMAAVEGWIDCTGDKNAEEKN